MKLDIDYAVGHGIIDTSHVRQLIEMAQRKEYLEQHPYRIWQGKNGFWYTYLDIDGRKMLKKRTKREAIENDIVSYWRDREESPTVRQAFDNWIEWKYELSKIERTTYERYRGVFARFYGDWEKRKLKNITPEEFIDFLERQVPKHKLSAKSFSNLKTITRGFLKRAKRNKFITWNVEYMLTELDVSERDFRKDYKEDYQEVYNVEEMERTIAYLLEDLTEKNLAILLMFITGIRVGELVTLKHDDFGEGFIHIRRTEQHYKDVDGKYQFYVKDSPKTQAGIRTVVIPNGFEWLIKKIRMINPFGEWVFTDKNGVRLNEKQIEYRLYRVCKNLKIYYKSPHKIRKTYISILLDSNLDSRFVTDQVGHVDVSISERHYHRNRKTIEKKQELLDGVDEFQGLKLLSKSCKVKSGLFTRKTGIP